MLDFSCNRLHLSGTQFLKQSVEQHLCRKYQTSFNFYRVKSINELLQGYAHSLAYIQHCDIRTYVDDTQFLRRVYYYRTLTGRQQITQRIQLCGDYYSKSKILTYEYPMMVVTNTKSLFVKRNRRLRKIQAGEGSSDETQQKDQDIIDFWERESQDYLAEIDNSSVEGSAGDEEESSYQQEMYDVYEVEGQGQEEQKIELKEVREGDLGHLIHDMTQNQQKIEHNLKMENKTLSVTSTTVPQSENNQLTNIFIKFGGNSQQNQPKTTRQNSITVKPIDQGIGLGTQRKMVVFDALTNLMNHKKVDYSHLIGYENAAVQQYCPKVPSPMDSLQQQRSQLQNRRRKIREKAEQLLKRVRSDTQQTKQQLNCF